MAAVRGEMAAVKKGDGVNERIRDRAG